MLPVEFCVSFVVSLPLRGSTFTAGGRRNRVVEGPDEIPIGRVKPPAVGDGDHRLPFLADAAQEDREIFEGVDRLLFAAPEDHLLRDPLIGGDRLVWRWNARIAEGVLILDRIAEIQPIAFAPPLAREDVFDGRPAPRERDVAGGHAGRHRRDVVVGADQTVERVHERPGDGARGVPLHVLDVEEQHEHAGARVLNGPPRFLHGVRLATALLPGVAPDEDAFELLDFLGTLSSTTSKSSWRRSVTGAPSSVG